VKAWATRPPTVTLKERKTAENLGHPAESLFFVKKLVGLGLF